MLGHRAFWTFVLVFTLSGCGGGTSSSTSTTPPNNLPPTNGIASITVSCATSPCAVQTSTLVPPVTRTVQLTGHVTCNGTCNTALTWSVTSGNGSVDSSGLYAAATTAPTEGVATVKALGSDGTTYATISISVTQSPVPVLIAFINTGVSSTTCGGGTRAQCSVVNVFSLSTPTSVIQVEPYSVSQDLWPAISADQSTIAYVADNAPGYPSAIFTVPTNGGTPNLVNGWGSSYSVSGVDWKPDGSGLVIAYWDYAAGVAGLATMLKNGTSITPLTATNQTCAGNSCFNPPDTPRYLTDGRIVYSAAGSQGNGQVFVLSADGGTKNNISNNGAQEGGATPSPDGTKVVYQTNRDGIIDIYTANIDGTNARPLVSTPSAYPTWCPGNKIIFMNLTVGGPDDLHSINSDGTGAVQLTTGGNTVMPYCR